MHYRINSLAADTVQFGSGFRNLIAACLCCFVVACGGGGGGGSDSAGGATNDVDEGADADADVIEPDEPEFYGHYTVSIEFPLNGSSTEGVDQILVRGKVELEEGAIPAGSIDSFTVNGSGTDIDIGSGEWASRVFLDEGVIEITTQLAAAGEVEQASIVVNNMTAPLLFKEVKLYSDSSALLAKSGTQLTRIDLETGEFRKLVDVPDGFPFSSFVMNSSETNAYYFQVQFDSGPSTNLIEVDLVEDSYTTIARIQALEKNDVVDYVLSPAEDAIIYSKVIPGLSEFPCTLNEFSFDSPEISSTTILQYDQRLGPLTTLCINRMMVAKSDQELVFSALAASTFRPIKALFSYDMDGGDLRAFSGDGVGSGPSFRTIVDLYASDRASEVLALDYRQDDDAGDIYRVLRVNKVSGKRSVVRDDIIIPGGVEFNIDYDALNKRLLFAANDGGSIQAVNLVTGQVDSLVTNSESSELAVGSGVGLASLSPLHALDSFYSQVDDRLYVVDLYSNNLVALEPDSLERSVIVEPLLTDQRTDMSPYSTAPGFGNVRAAIDGQRNKLYIADSVMPAYFDPDYLGAFVRQVDLGTGKDNVLASKTIGSGPVIERAYDISVDVENNSLYVSVLLEDGRYGVIGLDIDSGQRELLYDSGTEWNLAPLVHFFDKDSGRLLLVLNQGDIYSLDLQTLKSSLLVSNDGWPDGQIVDCEPVSFDPDIVAGRMLLQRTCGGSINYLYSIDIDAVDRVSMPASVRRISVDSQKGVIYGSAGHFWSEWWVAIDRDTGNEIVIAREG